MYNPGVYVLQFRRVYFYFALMGKKIIIMMIKMGKIAADYRGFNIAYYTPLTHLHVKGGLNAITMALRDCVCFAVESKLVIVVRNIAVFSEAPVV